jgi:hypothetical protein
MEEYYKDDLERFRVMILGYLSYLLNNTPVVKFGISDDVEMVMLREKVHYLIDICLDAQKDGIKFDRVKYVGDELKRVEHYYTDIMTMEQFFKAMERNEKLENLGI